MENTGRNLASLQSHPSLFDNRHVGDKACGNTGHVLSVCVYRLSAELGTVLHRKVTTRHLMTLVSSNDLFKAVCGGLHHECPSCIFRVVPSCYKVKTHLDKH